jgi:UDP-glucose 4-epimerase
VRTARSTGVGHLVYVSTLGVYAPRPAAPVDEGWPDSGQRTSAYSRHKVAVERMLDRFALDNPEITITRFRPTLVTQRDAAAAIKRLFLGPLVPRLALDALRRGLLPVLPMPAGLALQFVHADDVGDAVVRILEGRRGGIFNLAADVLHPDALAGLVGSRPLELPRAAVRAAVSVLHHLHLLAVSPGWFDMATNTPLMDSGRAHAELGWQPRRTSSESGRELVAGLADGAAGASPALAGR